VEQQRADDLGRPHSGRYYLTLGGSMSSYLDSGRTPTVGQWEHVAATYDGSVARFYIGWRPSGEQVRLRNRQLEYWRLGAYGGSPTGFFDGLIDNVRVYDRPLSASEIQADMASPIQSESIPPTVTAKTPAPGSEGISAVTAPTAKFSEPMAASSITSTTFQLKDAANAVVPATVAYNATTQTATLTPQSALAYGTTYTATVKGGAGGVTDVAGNALAADAVWSFTTEASAPQVLVVTSTANPFGSYLAEILRNEGLNAFTTMDVAFISPTILSGFDVVLLGETPLSAPQVSTLTGWVNGGGNLVAMRPDAQLAGLLGLTSAGGTRANAYLQVDTYRRAGSRDCRRDDAVPRHGRSLHAERCDAVATQYSNSTTATTNPAVTLRAVGSSGGQAAAFTFDLARSVVYTRQGNPAWDGQERDGVAGIRPDDMFFGAAAGDPQADWLDTSKIAIPQADEQQRLLVNLITLMNSDKTPLPRFWYLPRGEKAVVVMSGDDHGAGGTAFHFDRFKSDSTPGCVVANWECVRSTSFIYPNVPLTNAQAAAYVADGFEVALHPVYRPVRRERSARLSSRRIFDTQLSAFKSKYTSVPSPVSSRTHCVYWPSWTASANVELAHGMRMDGNYYHYPSAWIGATPGFLNGGGFPMRFAGKDGTPVDVYQENTNMTDEAGQAYPATVNALLDNALGPKATTAPSARTCIPTTLSLTPVRTRLSPRRRREMCP
jgi:hypothetical protein